MLGDLITSVRKIPHAIRNTWMSEKANVKAIVLFFFLLLLAVDLYAYQLSPLSVTYSPSGIDSTKAYTITNDSDLPIAIEVKAYKRFIDTDGNEYTELAPQYFSIQPAKMIIRPQSSQIVRVQYRGPKTVTKEMSFRIVSEQITYSQGASLKQGNQMINFLFVYGTAAYVKPTKVIESVTGSAVYMDGKIEITIANTGSVHQILDNLSVTISDQSKSYKLTEEELEGLKGVNLLTDTRLIKTIECPEMIGGASSYRVDVKYSFSY